MEDSACPELSVPHFGPASPAVWLRLLHGDGQGPPERTAASAAAQSPPAARRGKTDVTG